MHPAATNSCGPGGCCCCCCWDARRGWCGVREPHMHACTALHGRKARPEGSMHACALLLPPLAEPGGRSARAGQGRTGSGCGIQHGWFEAPRDGWQHPLLTRFSHPSAALHCGVCLCSLLEASPCDEVSTPSQKPAGILAMAMGMGEGHGSHAAQGGRARCCLASTPQNHLCCRCQRCVHVRELRVLRCRLLLLWFASKPPAACSATARCTGPCS